MGRRTLMGSAVVSSLALLMVAATAVPNASGATRPHLNGIANDNTNVWFTIPGTSSGTGHLISFKTSTDLVNHNFAPPSHHLKHQYQLAVCGTRLWIGNGNSIDELNAATGAYIGIFNSVLLNNVSGVACDSTDVWAVSNGNHQVVEINNARVLVHLYPAANFTNPSQITEGAGYIWVVNGNSTLTEAKAGTPYTVAPPLNAAYYGFNAPTSITNNGVDVFVANANATVTEFPSPVGTALTTHNFAGPDGAESVVTNGSGAADCFWVLGLYPREVEQYHVTTNAVVQTIHPVASDNVGFTHPVALTVDGAKVWMLSTKVPKISSIQVTNSPPAVHVYSY